MTFLPSDIVRYSPCSFGRKGRASGQAGIDFNYTVFQWLGVKGILYVTFTNYTKMANNLTKQSSKSFLRNEQSWFHNSVIISTKLYLSIILYKLRLLHLNYSIHCHRRVKENKIKPWALFLVTCGILHWKVSDLVPRPRSHLTKRKNAKTRTWSLSEISSCKLLQYSSESIESHKYQTVNLPELGVLPFARIK